MCIASWGSLHPAKSHHFTRLAGVALIAVSPVCHSSFARGLHCLSACLLAALSCRVPVSELPPRMADYPSSGGKHLIPQFQPLRRVVLITHQRICLVSVSGGLPDRAHNHRLHRTHTAATGKPQAVIPSTGSRYTPAHLCHALDIRFLCSALVSFLPSFPALAGFATSRPNSKPARERVH